MTAFSGVFVGIGQSPCETRIWRRTYSALFSHSALVFGGVNGNSPFRSLGGWRRMSSGGLAARSVACETGSSKVRARIVRGMFTMVLGDEGVGGGPQAPLTLRRPGL